MGADLGDSVLGIGRYRSGGDDDSPPLSKVGITRFSRVHFLDDAIRYITRHNPAAASINASVKSDSAPGISLVEFAR